VLSPRVRRGAAVAPHHRQALDLGEREMLPLPSNSRATASEDPSTGTGRKLRSFERGAQRAASAACAGDMSDISDLRHVHRLPERSPQRARDVKPADLDDADCPPAASQLKTKAADADSFAAKTPAAQMRPADKSIDEEAEVHDNEYQKSNRRGALDLARGHHVKLALPSRHPAPWQMPSRISEDSAHDAAASQRHARAGQGCLSLTCSHRSDVCAHACAVSGWGPKVVNRASMASDDVSDASSDVHSRGACTRRDMTSFELPTLQPDWSIVSTARNFTPRPGACCGPFERDSEDCIVFEQD
jgi:hypothetical protein